MEVFLNEISYNYEIYEEKILKNFLPNYSSKQQQYNNFPPPKKTKIITTTNNDINILGGYIYSAVGDANQDTKKQEKLLNEIVNTLIYSQLKNGIEYENKYLVCIFMAIALFQLNADDSTTKEIGYWLDETIESFRRNEAVAISSQQQQQRDFSNFSEQLLQKLLLKKYGISTNYDEIKQKLKEYTTIEFTLSEIGMLTVYEIILSNPRNEKIDANNLYNVLIINSSNHHYYYDNDVGPNLSTVFMPITKTKKSRQWIKYNDYFLHKPHVFKKNEEEEEEEERTIAVDDDNKYVLVRISTLEMFQMWAVSYMMTRCYLILGEKHGYEVATKYRERVLDIELVIDDVSRNVCVRISGCCANEMQDTPYFQKDDPYVYQFIAVTIATYRRMLLYINPNFILGTPTHDHFIHTNHDGCLSKMFFVALKPSMHTNPELSPSPEAVINNTNDIISKFFISNASYTTYNSIFPIFQIERYMNDEEIIIAGAKFIKNIYKYEDPPFIKYTRSNVESLTTFINLLNYQIL